MAEHDIRKTMPLFTGKILKSESVEKALQYFGLNQAHLME